MKQSVTFLAFLMLCFGISYGQSSCTSAPTMNCNQTYNSNNASSSHANNFNANTYGGCYNGNSSFNGRDRLYKVTVPSGNNLTIDMWNLTADLDLFVFRTCDGSIPYTCLGASTNSNNSSERVTVNNASGTYYVAVDGYNSNQVGSFQIKATCTPSSGGGGSISCSDAERLACGNSYNRSTIGEASRLNYNDLGACANGISQSSNPFTGGDDFYRIDVPTGSTLKISMTGLSADLDMFLFKSCSSFSGEISSFELENCLARSINGNQQNEAITVNNASGSYYLLVDGPRPEFQSNYRLSIDCDNCNDQEDLDCDALSSSYIGTDGALLYRFSVAGAPSGGTWTIQNTAGGSVSTSVGSNTINANFSSGGTYRVCYTYTKSDGCTFRCCKTIYIEDCEEEEDLDCDAMTYAYTGSGGSLLYRFTVAGAPNGGTWTVQRTSGGNVSTSVGNNTTNATFSSTGTYRVCYSYTKSDGCTYSCCKTFYIANPYDCDNITYNYNSSNNSYVLTIPGVSSSQVIRWQDDDTGANLGSSTSVNVPVSGSCRVRNFSVLFYDPGLNAYRICCISIFMCDPYDCDNITYSYNSSSNRYTLSIPGISDGNVLRWRDDDTGANIGTTSSVNIAISGSCRVRNFSVLFYDPAINAYRICCISIYICDPYDCNNITYSYNAGSNSYVLTIPGISSGQVIRWQDDDTGANLGSSTSVSVPVSGSCRVRNFSVLFFDPGVNGYRLCCISIYICDPYDCNNITYSYNAGSNSYVLTIPGISSGQVIRWQDDDTGANLGSSTSVSVPVSGSCRVRNFSVLFFDPGVNGYRLCCISIYICDPYDCNNITYSYNAGSNSYVLTIPGISSGQVIRWQDDDTGANLGSSTSVSVPVSGSCRVRNFSVLFFDPGVNGYRLCCISIYVCDPYDCDNITKFLDPATNIWTLAVDGLSSANVLFWKDDATGAQLAGATSSITITNPNPGNCRYISVHYFDPATNSYRVCCLSICKDANGCTGTPSGNGICPTIFAPVCGCDGNEYGNSCEALSAGVQSWTEGPCADPVDPKCDELTFSYVSPLRYTFSVPSTFPGGTWTVEGGVFTPARTIGTDNAIAYTFPSAGTFTICYNYYTDGGVVEGDLVQCCKTIEIIDNPYDCDAITYGYNPSTGKYELSLPDISDADVAYWQDDDRGVVIGTTSTVSIDVDSNCRVRSFSVVFYDAAVGGYRICCISIFICNPYNCNSIVQNYNPTNNTVSLSLPGVAASQVLFWRNDDTGQQIAGGTSSITVNYPASGACIAISVLFYDPAINGYRICCLEICNDQPEECASIVDERLVCKEDGSYDYTFTLINNSGYLVDASFTMQTPIGITFNNCTLTQTVNNIGASRTITLNIDNCLTPLNTGMLVTYKVVLQEAGKTEGWCCHLDPKSVTIPECGDQCVGIGEDVICTTIYEPVCGCDGVTYPNACVASQVGVRSIVSGPCDGDQCDNVEDLVKNGDFEGGNWSFVSTYDSGCFCGDNTYCIRANARDKCSAWNATTGDGKFLIVEGAAGNAGKIVWEQNVIVTTGVTYTFFADFYPNLTAGSRPILQFYINDAPVGNSFEGFNNQWRTYAIDWLAPAGTDFAKLQIRKVGSSGGTNDFGIDNVRFEFCLDDIGGTPEVDNDILTEKDFSSSISMMASPNPFTDVTEIKFNLDADMPATISVFNMDGKQVFLQEGDFHAGTNIVTFEADGSLASGIYYYRLETAVQSITKPMVLMKY